jgi:hypothetical protein
MTSSISSYDKLENALKLQTAAKEADARFVYFHYDSRGVSYKVEFGTPDSHAKFQEVYWRLTKPLVEKAQQRKSLPTVIKTYGTRIVTGVLLTVCILVLSFKAFAHCPNYTEEQNDVMRLAYSVGVSHDLGYTLAAIVRQESFVGPYIIRLNPKDGAAGSYGLTHITLEWLRGHKNITSMWAMLEEYPARLMSDDVFALTMGLHHLLANQHRGWRPMLLRYNGGSDYAGKIAVHLKELKGCLKVDDMN